MLEAFDSSLVDVGDVGWEFSVVSFGDGNSLSMKFIPVVSKRALDVSGSCTSVGIVCVRIVS